MFQPETEYDVVPTSIDVKDFHEYPDHIVAWVKGGSTKAWNGQVLCQKHNASKGAR
jgi:hypothetical protein